MNTRTQTRARMTVSILIYYTILLSSQIDHMCLPAWLHQCSFSRHTNAYTHTHHVQTPTPKAAHGTSYTHTQTSLSYKHTHQHTFLSYKHTHTHTFQSSPMPPVSGIVSLISSPSSLPPIVREFRGVSLWVAPPFRPEVVQNKSTNENVAEERSHRPSTCAWMHVCMRVHMCVHRCLHVCMRVYGCMDMHMHACMDMSTQRGYDTEPQRLSRRRV